MILSPGKLIDKIESEVRVRLGPGVEAVAFFTPRSPLAEGLSKREARQQQSRAAAFALTPDRIQAFSFKDRGWTGIGTIQEQLGSWPRSGVRVERSATEDRVRLEDGPMTVTRNLVTLGFPGGSSIMLVADEGIERRRDLAETFLSMLGGSAVPPR
ncbi:MAG: hypothetical protein ACRDH9_02425 [Actinomycetota bacterium]